MFQESEEDLKGVWTTRRADNPIPSGVWVPLYQTGVWITLYQALLGAGKRLLWAQRWAPSPRWLWWPVLKGATADPASPGNSYVPVGNTLKLRKKIMLVIFFSYKAPLSAADHVKKLASDRPRARPCPGSCGTPFLMDLSSSPLFFFFFFFSLPRIPRSCLYTGLLCLWFDAWIMYLVGCMCVCSLSSEAESCPDLCHLLGKYLSVMDSLEIHGGSHKIIVASKWNTAGENEHFSIGFSVTGTPQF